MQSAKEHIRQIVEEYIKLFPQDFQLFKDGMQHVRGTLKDEKFGTTEGTTMRALFEMPVDLSEMLIMQLSEEEMEWFKAGGIDRKEGGRWFAKTFPVFRLADSV